MLSCKHSKINCFFILYAMTDLPELASKFSANSFDFVDINFCLKIVLFLSFITSVDCKKKRVYVRFQMCDLSFESAAQATCTSCVENNTASFAMLHSQFLVLLLYTFRDLHLQYLSFKWNRGQNLILLFIQKQLINQFEKFQQSDSLKAVVFLVNLIQL